jgi:nucleoside-specific outer membrane channel protein Tsx
MKTLTLAALGLVALVAVPAQAAIWSDTSLGFKTSSNFQEPGVKDSVKKDIFSLTHASGYSVGSNFFNVDMLKSGPTDPANTEGTVPGQKSDGAQEVYVTYKHTLSLSKVFSTKMEFGPVRDMEVTGGFDYSAKNTTFAPQVWKLMVGPQFSFKVPGFLTVAVLYYKETNHNSFGAFNIAKGGSLNPSFDPTYQIAGAWGIDAPIGAVNTKVKGFFTYTGAKGKDGSGVETKPETLFNIYWMGDISPIFGAKKGTFQVGPGFQYWNNKFGDPTYATPADVPAGSVVNPKTSAFMVSLEYHF